MIGGLADWFAVTALFRHPLWLPIPHTAIIPRKKDQLGEALSGFVGDNFLNAQLITEKVSQARIPERAGEWLAQPENGEKVSREVGKLTANIVRAIDPSDAEAVIKSAVIDKLAEPTWGPPAGRLLEQLLAEGKAEPVVQELAQWLHKKALGSEPLIDRLLNERRPIWAPKFTAQLVSGKVYDEVIKFTEAVAADPNHEARKSLRRFLNKLAQDLQHDPGMIIKVEEIKRDIMGSGAIAQAAPTIWRQPPSRSLNPQKMSHQFCVAKLPKQLPAGVKDCLSTTPSGIHSTPGLPAPLLSSPTITPPKSPALSPKPLNDGTLKKLQRKSNSWWAKTSNTSALMAQL